MFLKYNIGYPPRELYVHTGQMLNKNLDHFNEAVYMIADSIDMVILHIPSWDA
jgi:hypothetical protein